MFNNSFSSKRKVGVGFSLEYTPMPEHKKCPDFSSKDFKNNPAVSSIYGKNENKQIKEKNHN